MHVWVVGKDGLVGSVAAQKGQIATSRHEVNIENIEEVRSFAKKHPEITYIINCAALSLVDFAETHQKEAYAANVIGPCHLALVAREIGAHLTHISTDYVYPGNGAVPLKETDSTDPCNYYGKTKLAGEQKVLDILPSACILRTSWIFGEGGKNFIAKLIDLFKKEKIVRLTDDHWGRPTFTYDLVEVLFQLHSISGIYHFANHGVTNKYLFGMRLLDELKKRKLPLHIEQIIPVPSSSFPCPAKRPAYSVLDTAKIEQTLSMTVRSWEDALDEFLCSKLGR